MSSAVDYTPRSQPERRGDIDNCALRQFAGLNTVRAMATPTVSTGGSVIVSARLVQAHLCASGYLLL